MKTKVILHGGNSSHKSEDNERFFYEVINSVDSDIVKILCIYFARPEHRWEDSYAEDQSIFFSLETLKEIETKLANYDMDELLEEIKEADIIFINGGRSGHLKETLEKVDNFSDLIVGKVLVGISAGANILSRYYYSSVADGIRAGMGLLPVKLFTHYTEADGAKLGQLESYQEELPVFKIAEEHYLVLEDSLINNGKH